MPELINQPTRIEALCAAAGLVASTLPINNAAAIVSLNALGVVVAVNAVSRRMGCGPHRYDRQQIANLELLRPSPIAGSFRWQPRWPLSLGRIWGRPWWPRSCRFDWGPLPICC